MDGIGGPAHRTHARGMFAIDEEVVSRGRIPYLHGVIIARRYDVRA